MDRNVLHGLRERTDAKLRFAQVHLDELKESGTINGSDFDRAHQESFLYHLVGAKDSFLLELNIYYDLQLPAQDISAGKIREALEKVGRHSRELAEIYTLENQEDSWLFHAKEMRDYGTHISNVPRAYHLGGENDRMVFLKNPTTGKIIESHFVIEFEDWFMRMKNLLEELRISAIERNGISSD